jgi:hypothetical protein
MKQHSTILPEQMFAKNQVVNAMDVFLLFYEIDLIKKK